MDLSWPGPPLSWTVSRRVTGVTHGSQHIGWGKSLDHMLCHPEISLRLLAYHGIWEESPWTIFYHRHIMWACDCISAPSLAHYVNLRPCQSLCVGWVAQIVKLRLKSRSLNNVDIRFLSMLPALLKSFLGDLPKVGNIFSTRLRNRILLNWVWHEVKFNLLNTSSYS